MRPDDEGSVRAPSSLTVLRHRLAATIAARPGAAVAAPGPDGSWGDIDYADQTPTEWRPSQHLARVRQLAVNARGGGAPAAQAQALSALRWWLAHDPAAPSWWHRQIGAPRLLGEAALLLAGELDAADVGRAQVILERAGDFILMSGMAPRAMNWTGANRLWISANRLLLGTLIGDETIISGAVTAGAGELRVASRGEDGIQADFSFHQHGPLLFNGSYGRFYLLESVFLLQAVHGTPWQPAEGRYRLLADFLLDGTRWMLRGEDFDFGCRDREMTRPRVTCRDLAPAAAFLAEACPARAEELLGLAEGLRTGAAPGALAGNRMFPRSDFMVQQEPGWRVSVRMHSLRTVRAECCNGEGRRSHHLSDGLTCLMRSGTEYRDLFPVWDWQRLPGTTCLRTLRNEFPDTVFMRGTAEAVGGTGDGRTGVCTQHLRSDHLVARKSWFFDQEGVVCLGAGIRSAFAGVVGTTLDQSRIQGAVITDAAPDRPLPAGRHRASSARWLAHGQWGFWFPQATDVEVELGPRTGAWSDIGAGPSDAVSEQVFLAVINHGEAPEGAAYAYAILPGANAAGLARFTATPSFEVLENSPRLQAVWRPAGKLLQAAFFGAGELVWNGGWKLRVEGECAVQITLDTHGNPRVFAAETRQLAEFFEGRLSDPMGATRWEGRVPFPGGDAAGITLRIV